MKQVTGHLKFLCWCKLLMYRHSNSFYRHKKPPAWEVVCKLEVFLLYHAHNTNSPTGYARATTIYYVRHRLILSYNETEGEARVGDTLII